MRKKLIYLLFEWTQKIYIKHKKKDTWNITKTELLTYPKYTLGYKIGNFLHQNNFDLLPKVERHDAYHVITGYGTKVEDEVALQYVCMGNGKRSWYSYGTVIIGTILLPEYLSYFFKSYKLGKECNVFHYFDFKKLLNEDFKELQKIIFTKKQMYEFSI